jgi:hypothetical protein
VIIDIADAVVATLNAAHLSQPVQAERFYLPEFELKDMGTLHISVVPAECEEELADRERDFGDYTIHVAVQQRVGKLDNATLDGLMSLVEEIGDLFRHQRLPGYEQAQWLKTENRPIYDPKHLKEHGQFTSLLVLTFQVVR